MARAKKSHAEEVASLIAKINRSKERIAAERDKLRDLLVDVEAICQDSEDAEFALENAVDYLSRQL